MKLVQAKTFQNTSVRLDGKQFRDCIFEDCTLEYSGGDVAFERCSLLRCKHLLYGYARQTAKYMRSIGIMDDTKGKWAEYTGAVN